MPETLIVEVKAGMANRLRAFVSAMCLAEDLAVNLQIVWSANDPACMARFETLFDETKLPSWLTVIMASVPVTSTEVLSPEDLDVWLSNPPTPIHSYGHFYQKDPQRWLKHLRSIKPHPSIRIPPVPPMTVGVHIRRGDHMKAKIYSPIKAFIQVMQQEHKSTQFIIATDSMAEREAVQVLFGERVTFPSISLSRMTQHGMNSAVADFMALSLCCKVYGSYASSFSELAAMYGGVPLHVIKNESPY
jgi:hypothetical protein